MRYAIISDLHANLQAFEAVLADIGRREFDTLVCLGDIVGYGPQPAETLALCQQECHNFILGNHDAVAGEFLDPSIFNDDAQRSAKWTVAQLGQQARDFFKRVPLTLEGDDLFLSHATLSNPAGFGYLDTPEDAAPEFAVRPESAIFVGHTHHAKAFQLDVANAMVGELPPEDFQIQPGFRYIINPGSVGDPRTPEPFARYASFDSETGLVRFFALEFDIDAYRAAWQASRCPYQQYFHRCLDGDIPLAGDDGRVAPPPRLMSHGLREAAASGGTVVQATNPAGQLGATRRLSTRPSASGALPAGRPKKTPREQGTEGESTQALDAAALAPPKSFPWSMIFLLLLFVVAGGLAYLRFYTDFGGIGFSSEVQKRNRQNEEIQRTLEEQAKREAEEEAERERILAETEVVEEPEPAKKKPEKPPRPPAPGKTPPIYRSEVVTPKTPGQAVEIDVNLPPGTRKIFLAVHAGKDNTHDWANWCEPRLVLENGSERRLTTLKWSRAASAWKDPRIGKNVNGKPMEVAGKAVDLGIGVHAHSLLVYELPVGIVGFRARGAIDDGGASQEGGVTSVEFLVYTVDPGPIKNW